MEITAKYCTIYLVRHGETENNIKEIIQGQTDSPLTPLGVKQAQSRGQDFKDINFSQVFSSDLGRAQHTAEFVKFNRQLIINTTELLREKLFGIYEGTDSKKYYEENKDAFEKLRTLGEQEKMAFKTHPSMESNQEVATRMLVFLREIAVTYPGENILVVSHGTAMRITLMHLGVGTFDQLPAGCVENLGYIKLKSDGVDFFIEEMHGVNILPLNSVTREDYIPT